MKEFLFLKIIFYRMNYELNGVCERYKAKRNHDLPSRYTERQKRCNVWDFYRMSENRCPCCNYKIRSDHLEDLEWEKNIEKIINRYLLHIFSDYCSSSQL